MLNVYIFAVDEMEEQSDGQRQLKTTDEKHVSPFVDLSPRFASPLSLDLEAFSLTLSLPPTETTTTTTTTTNNRASPSPGTPPRSASAS